MARYTFGGSLPDYTISPSGALISAPVTFWSLQVGGVQYTDLLVGGTAASTVTSVGGAIPVFSGPDGVLNMWADGGGGTRALIRSSAVDALASSASAGLAAKAAADLSNVTPATGRTALGLGSASTQPASAFDAGGAATAAQTAAATDATTKANAAQAAAISSAPVQSVAGLTGAPTAAQLETAGLLRSSTATATYQAVVQNNIVVWLGDSITNLNGNGTNLIGDNYTGYVAALSGGRILDPGPRYATGGFTLAQIQTTWLPSVLALSGNQKPGRAVIAGGTNDAGAAGFSAAASLATLTQIVNSLIGAGIKPILTTIPPRNDSTTANAKVQTWNATVVRYALTQGLQYLDLHGALVDPTTGLYLPGLAADGIHPSPAGMKAMALAVYPALRDSLPAWLPYLTDNLLDSTNLIPSGQGLFLNGGGSLNFAGGNANVGQGWNIFGGAPVPSFVSDGLIPGRWQRVTHDASANNTLAQCNTQAAVPGRRYMMGLKLRTSGLSSTSALNISMDFINGSGGFSPVNGWTQDLGGILTVYMEGVATAGTTGVRISAGMNGNPAGGAFFDLGQVTIRDLTALGFA